MLLLVTTNDQIKLITGGSQSLDIHASWVDTLSGVQTAGTTDTNVASATTTVIVDHPASSTARNIKLLSIHNNDASASNTITIERYNGSTAYVLQKITLPAGYSYTFTDQAGWILSDASGGRVETPLTGRFVGFSFLTSASANFTTGPATNTIKYRGVAGGGQGGGSATTTGFHGSGGGAGSDVEGTIAVTPNTSYAYTCGAGGSTGGTGAGGQNGANSALVIGGTTITCNGGTGGAVGTSATVPVLGGSGGVVSTNGTRNGVGQSGFASLESATVGVSGMGGSGPFGAGGKQNLFTGATGNAAGGNGAGGGGGSSTGTAKAGGAGAGGCWIIEEYS